MTGYVENPMGEDPWAQDRIYRKVTDDLRIRYESQGNLAVQTVVLLTSVEQLMEKTNALLEQLNATMSDFLVKLGDLNDSKVTEKESDGDGSEDRRPHWRKEQQ